MLQLFTSFSWPLSQLDLELQKVVDITNSVLFSTQALPINMDLKNTKKDHISVENKHFFM